jgi:type IV pilus assembly protein PilB
VVTVEDPVEKRLPLMRQTQINPKAGLTFATGLRSILRQDPDVLMVGEIRDRETAEIAVQAALTGHLLLSTLHTNTAAGALVRLTEMGIPPFLITSSLRAVIGQRLARRNCDACKREVEAEPSLAAAFGMAGAGTLRVLAGAGCARCLHTGFKGRVGLYELLEITPALGRAIVGGGSRDAIEEAAAGAVDGGLWRDGLRKVRQGLTTLEEVARVVGVPHAGDAV